MMQQFLSKRYSHYFLATLFYVAVGYGFFVAATNMNYVWQWGSIPKYFVYEAQEQIVVEADGEIQKRDGQEGKKGEWILIKEEDESVVELNIPEHFSLLVSSGDFVYTDDEIAEYKTLQPGPILNGLWMTIKISIFSAIIVFFIGIIVAFMRLSSLSFLNYIASVYIAIVRGTPLLVQILLFYFIVANIFELSTFWAGVISLGVFFGAYCAEILRGAIQSIDRGQTEAAKSLGLNYFQIMGYIILPQAFKRALPTLVGEMISLVKDSSLVSVISLTDLTKVGREIVANTFSPFETWIVIACVYLSITFSLSFLGHRLEKKMKTKGGM